MGEFQGQYLELEVFRGDPYFEEAIAAIDSAIAAVNGIPYEQEKVGTGEYEGLYAAYFSVLVAEGTMLDTRTYVLPSMEAAHVDFGEALPDKYRLRVHVITQNVEL